jgi:hypothetical protein
MDRKTLGIVILSMSAAFLLAISFLSQPTAQAVTVSSGRDYQAATARALQGGDSLYVLDNKTGRMAILVYDTRDRQLKVRHVRSLSDR